MSEMPLRGVRKVYGSLLELSERRVLSTPLSLTFFGQRVPQVGWPRGSGRQTQPGSDGLVNSGFPGAQCMAQTVPGARLGVPSAQGK